MRVLNYLAIATMAIGLTACNNSDPNSVTLKVESELGELAAYMTPTDEEVTVQLTEEKEGEEVYKVIVSSLSLNVTTSVLSNRGFNLEVEVLDKNHIKITDLPDFKIESKHIDTNSDMDRALYAGAIRAQMRYGGEASKWEESNQQMWDKIRKEGVYILIKPSHSNADYVEYDVNASKKEISYYDEKDMDGGEDSAMSYGDEDWDELLDAYENSVNSYISFMKKAAMGDLNALAEYPSVMSKAQELSEKMQDAEGSMSASQWQRHMEISAKMALAAAEML